MESELPALKKVKVDPKLEPDESKNAKSIPKTQVTGEDDVKRKIPTPKPEPLNITMGSESPALKKVKVDPKLEPDDSKHAKSIPKTQVTGKNDVKRKIPTPKPKPLKITDLNEQCQFELLQRLNLSDLCAMAEVSTQYRELAQKFFSVKHRKIELTSLIDAPGGKYSLLKVRQLLSNFGYLISTLIIDLGQLIEIESASKMLALVRKYCFETIDEMSFVNQPNERFNEYIISMLFGTELMTRKSAPGRYHTRNKMTFTQGKSVQTQILEPMIESDDSD